MRCIPLIVAFSVIVIQAQSQKPWFRENWKEIEAALPVTQEHVEHSNLELRVYGPARDQIKKSNHPDIPNDPFYIWSGECRSNWALALRHRLEAIDLSGNAKVKMRVRQSGFRQLRLILKVRDGSWLVSDRAVASSDDWIESEFDIKSIRWRKLNIETISETGWIDKPDLSYVEEIGFTDLMSGGGTPASSRVDWIEVFGQPVKR